MGELATRVIDLLLGKKVDGTIYTRLPTREPSKIRYLVDTKDGRIDVSYPQMEYDQLSGITNTPPFYENEPLDRGDRFSKRVRSAILWEDGQTL